LTIFKNRTIFLSSETRFYLEPTYIADISEASLFYNLDIYIKEE